MAKELCRTVYKRTILVAAVAAFSLLTTACKINKDANCLNPKASCYKKDTEAPSVVSTNPPSSPSNASPGTANALSSVIIYFSEPMKNAGDKASYPDPIGAGVGNGATQLRIASVTAFDEKTVQLNMSGTMASGLINFDLSLLTDLSGNTLTNPSMQFQGSGLTVTPATGWVGSTDVGTSSGYTSVTISWTNTTPYPVDWIIKKGGTSCTGGGVSGVTTATPQGSNLVTGLASGASPGNITLALSEFPVGPPTPLRVCMTNVGQGVDLQLSVDITRDNVAPTTTNITGGNCDLPFQVTITCSDNVDKIVYTMDSTGTGAVPPDPAFNLTTGAIITGTPYDTTNGYSITTRGNVMFKYLCIDKAGHLNTGADPSGIKSFTCQSTLKWDTTSLWAPAGPSQPYDVWK